MGNRAVLVTEAGLRDPRRNIGLYLHWNGGRDSVEAFLCYCRLQGYRSPEKDCYGWAALCCVISNFFGCQGLCVGMDTIDRLDTDNYDNGVYIIADWKIAGRAFLRNPEQNVYDTLEMLEEIDAAMPPKCRLGRERLYDRWQNDLKENVQ